MTTAANSTTTRGIQSLDAALQILVAMQARRGPVSLSVLARDCDMPPSKVHRYLASFLNANLVIQAGKSGKYDLGPGAVKLGLAAMARHDFVNGAGEALPDLCIETGVTAMLSVWGDYGPTVIRWERGPVPVTISMGLGTTLPLLNSATGRAFLAWAPPAPLRALRDAELRRARKKPDLAPDFTPTNKGLTELVDHIHNTGFASVDGRYIPGLVAVAAPILDWQKQAQAVITLVGTDPDLANSGSGVVRALIRFCRDHSLALP